MASKTTIANLALHRIGVSQLIANVETEQSQAAISINAVWDLHRDAVLRDFAWPWATAYATLGLVAGTSTTYAVTNEWNYSYRYPSDCLLARRIVTAAGRQTSTPPTFRVGRDSTGRLIYTGEASAVLEYTVKVTDPEEFDGLFVSMLAWKLAATIAPSQSRIADMAKTAMAMYLLEKRHAEDAAANEGQQPAPLEASWIEARN